MKIIGCGDTFLRSGNSSRRDTGSANGLNISLTETEKVFGDIGKSLSGTRMKEHCCTSGKGSWGEEKKEKVQGEEISRGRIVRNQSLLSITTHHTYTYTKILYITFTMKPDDAVSETSPSPSARGEPNGSSIKPNSSPRSVIGRLYQKLSPRKAERHSLSVDPNAAQFSELQRVFRYFDKDHDGKISPGELQSCLRAVGADLSPKEAELAVQSSDFDGDGLLGFEDFATLMEDCEEDDKNDELKEAFGMYEMEGTGSITPKSLKRMLSRLGESSTTQDCKAMIRMFDLNGDGVLNFEEFRIMMR
ncbi:hypothetical protein F0562_036191 [Nyssa sinensis]|uniref:EF-hand domain-containing protein n=1 Tax=Nyssa sinensis TaxID=561372 RepID=A0A5J5AGG7_9ASTE|nr:hypothetical protein F0562_036191 [Nyssa sinensis]